jgi:hypothetical protein
VCAAPRLRVPQLLQRPALAGDSAPVVRACAAGHFVAAWTRNVIDAAEEEDEDHDSFDEECPCENCQAEREEDGDDDDSEDDSEDDYE